MKSKKRTFLKLAIIASLFLLILGIFNLFNLFFETTSYHNLLAQKIENVIQRKVSIGSVRISIFNGLGFILENFSIEDKLKRGSFITSDRFIVSFYFLPLLKKRISIKEVRIIHPIIRIYRTGHGKPNSQNHPDNIIPYQKISEFIENEFILQTINKIVIKKGTLIIRGTKGAISPLATKITDISLEIKRGFLKKSINAVVQGKIISEDQPALFKIKSEIQNKQGDFSLENLFLKGYFNLSPLNIKPFHPYLKPFSWNTKLNGAVEVNLNYEGSFAKGIKSLGVIKFNHLGQPQDHGFPNSNKINQWEVIYDLFWNKEKLDFSELKIKLNDLMLTGKGFIGKPFSKNPLIGIEFTSTPFDINTSIPDSIFSLLPKTYNGLKDKFIIGNIQFENLGFVGNFNQFKNIHLQKNFSRLKGKLRLKKVDFIIDSNGSKLEKISGLLEFNKGNIKLSNISGEYKKSSISGLSLHISSPFDKPALNLSTRASLQLNQMYQILSQKTSLFDNIRDLKKVKDVSGKADIEINITGNPKKPSELTYKGFAELKNVSFYYEYLKHNIQNINGKVRFYSQSSLIPESDKEMKTFLQNLSRINTEKGKHFYISGFSGKYNQSTFQNLTGGFSVTPFQPVFDLKIKADAHLQDIYPLLVYYLNSIWGTGQWNKINITSGRSTAELKLTNLSPLTKEWDVLGNLHLKEVYASHNNFPLNISKINGRILFSKNEIIWKSIKGLIGKSTFNLNGKTLNYTSKNPDVDIILNSELNIKDVLKAIPFPEKDNYNIDGIVKINLMAKGNYHKMSTKSKIDLTQSSYYYNNWINKKNGQKNTARLDGIIEDFKNIYIDKLEMAFEKNKIYGDGAILDIAKPFLNLRLRTFDFDLAEITRYTDFLNGKPITGKLSTLFNLKGYIGGEKQLSIKGNASLLDGSYKFDFSPSTIKNINANINFTNQKITINNAALSFGKSDARITGEITDFNRPRFSLRIKSKDLDLNPILPKKMKSIKEINYLMKNSPLFLNTRGKISLDVGKGKFRQLNFPSLTGEIQLKNGRIFFHNMKMILHDSHVTTDALLNFLSDNGLSFSLKLHGKSLPAKFFENIFGNYFQESITGKLSVSTKLAGNGFNMGQIAKTLSGNLSLLLIKGDYNKQNLISGVKKIFGLGTGGMKGNQPKNNIFTEFDLIKGSFVINKGLAITENYVIETPERKTSIIGTLDLGEKSLDLSAGIAPWQNLNKAMSKIPIVGTILTGGDDKSLLVTYYRVKGKMASPKVSPVPLKSLGRKVISLFKGVFQTPGAIFAPSK